MSTSLRIQTAFDVVAITCCVCHAPFGMQKTHYERRSADHSAFWCPSCGKSQVFTGESDEARLKRELADATKQRDMAKQKQAWAEQNARKEKEEREEMQRQRDVARKNHKRTRERIKHGVCPCCKRTFKQLASHMAAKHPDYPGAVNG